MTPKYLPKEWVLFKLSTSDPESTGMGEIKAGNYDSSNKQWRYKITNPIGEATVSILSKDVTHKLVGSTWKPQVP